MTLFAKKLLEEGKAPLKVLKQTANTSLPDLVQTLYKNFLKSKIFTSLVFFIKNLTIFVELIQTKIVLSYFI